MTQWLLRVVAAGAERPQNGGSKFLSASTESIDRGQKLRRYAREGVAHVWLIDPLKQSLEVLTLDLGQWTLLGRHEGAAQVRAAPFDATLLELGALWIE